MSLIELGGIWNLCKADQYYKIYTCIRNVNYLGYSIKKTAIEAYHAMPIYYELALGLSYEPIRHCTH